MQNENDKQHFSQDRAENISPNTKIVSNKSSEDKWNQGQIEKELPKGVASKQNERHNVHVKRKNPTLRLSNRDPSLSKARLTFTHKVPLNPKHFSVKNKGSKEKNHKPTKYGKYSKLPKNFGYKKWGLRLPSKMLPVPKMNKRRPRKSDIDQSKNASQQRYQKFLKRKFKVERGQKDRIRNVR